MDTSADTSASSSAEAASFETITGSLVKSSAVRILPADPSRPLVLIVDGYTVSTPTPSETLAPNLNIKTAEDAEDSLARNFAPEFIAFSAGLVLVTLTALALLRARQGAG